MPRSEQAQMLLYIHPTVKNWIEGKARYDNDTMTGLVRRILREHIQRDDPEGWAAIEKALKAEAASPANGDQEDNEAAADGG